MRINKILFMVCTHEEINTNKLPGGEATCKLLSCFHLMLPLQASPVAVLDGNTSQHVGCEKQYNRAKLELITMDS